MIPAHRSHYVAAVAAFLGAAVLIAPANAIAQEDTRDRQTSTTRPQSRERPDDAERRAEAMDEVKSRCLNQIEVRHNALAAAKRRLSQAKFVTDEHEAALAQNIDATASSLSRLADVIQGEDNFEELRAECRSIVVDHRVFVLVIPRVRLVLASDAELAAAGRLTEVAGKLRTKIDEAKAQGKDTTEAENDLARMRSHIAAAKDHANTVYGAVINITPAQYNANHDVLGPARRAVRAAKEELRAAVAAAREVRQDLGEEGSARS